MENFSRTREGQVFLHKTLPDISEGLKGLTQAVKTLPDISEGLKGLTQAVNALTEAVKGSNELQKPPGASQVAIAEDEFPCDTCPDSCPIGIESDGDHVEFNDLCRFGDICPAYQKYSLR